MNLLIGWNAWSVLEFLMTGERVQDTYFLYKRGYYKNHKPAWLAAPFKVYSGQSIDKVFIPSCLSKEEYKFIHSLEVKEVYYLEEGEYDYNKYKDDDRHLRIPFYTMNPDKIANPDVFSEIRKLSLTPETINGYMKLYDISMPDDLYDVILYTDPLEIDFNVKNVKDLVESYMEKHHKNERILVKQHPRDDTVWQWDTCSDKIPAQLLLNRNVIHVFMFNTTILRYISNSKSVEMIDIISKYESTAKMCI